MKTYVWIKATPNSNPIKSVKTNKGIRKLKEARPSNNIILQANPTITFNKLCPAIKLMKSRTPKLIGFAIYETNSIGTKSNEQVKV